MGVWEPCGATRGRWAGSGLLVTGCQRGLGIEWHLACQPGLRSPCSPRSRRVTPSPGTWAAASPPYTVLSGQPSLGPGFPGLGSVCLQGRLGGCLRRRPCLEAPQEAPGEEGRLGPDLVRDGPCPGPSDPQIHPTWRPFLRRSCRRRSSALRRAGTASPQDFARLSTCSDVCPGAGFWKVPSS